ncbi:cell envelope integrity protein CreD [Croceitalea sp. MTPC9]|uniref:cell envelope integrity protein CreD n=1 Tax=unclassified Croceitalea TaxID=2632280 RepID=UPI002B38555B|nr:cell envelope integrity protein CreD [Croceitalea sp. MTPC6]GMN18052.1 cell envelope integrity protein CreD [Croceitalea sp. MTPC9]
METKRSRIGNWFKTSISARMIIVGFILVILLIPLSFVKDLIRERGFRQTEVIQEINQKWGNQVTLYGPIIKIPYKTYKEEKVFDAKSKTYIKTYEDIYHNAYFLPEDLVIDAKVDTESLERGIYESVVYTSDIKLKGSFKGFDFSTEEIPNKDILWNKATVLMKTSNLKGIRNEITIQLDTNKLSLKPQFDNQYMSTLSSGFIKNLSTDSIFAYSADIKINGSERLQFIPVGRETLVNMKSDWHSPSFNGNFLPDDKTKKIAKDGFEANWKVLETNRQFGQEFFDRLPDLSQFSFGTDLIIPVDDYQKTERTSKYGLLIIGLTLLVFLLIQIISKIDIHPFQYLMIGLALVMFYTLLISISEHQNFLKAYLIAGTAVIGLITIYSRTILKHNKFPLLIGGSLSALHTFIFVIIQLENYALLVGSIGLFIILAIIMFASKKIDWGNSD